MVALHYVHGLGILHRDIKPDNMVVCEGGYAKLTDFGISQKLDKAGKCKGGSGTVGYMAPEICAKLKEHAEPADFFAAGVMLHFLLTGKQVFEGKPTRDKTKKTGTWSDVVFPEAVIREGKKNGKRAPLGADATDLIEKVRRSLFYCGGGGGREARPALKTGVVYCVYVGSLRMRAFTFAFVRLPFQHIHTHTHTHTTYPF